MPLTHQLQPKAQMTEQPENVWLKQVPEKDFLTFWQCLVVFMVLFVVLFCLFSYFEWDSSEPHYEVDTTTPLKDAWGNPIYGKKIEGRPFDPTAALKPAAWVAGGLTAVVYLSNFSMGFRQTLGWAISKLFS
jgi:hypothetical protein